MKRVAIVQSNYIPWKGYFDLIGSVDEFILYDDVQYTNNDWRNRNLIKTPQGLHWLTVPVRISGRFQQLIHETEIAGSHWTKGHWKSLQLNYQRTPFFAAYESELRHFYMEQEFSHLSVLNRTFICWVMEKLGIRTHLSSSQNYVLEGDRNQRLVNLCRQAGATEYISGPAAREYLDETLFAQSGIHVTWFDYSNYPPYPQKWGAFEHGVTVLDLLFNMGPSSSRYLKSGCIKDYDTPISPTPPGSDHA
ncbi:WbqC family protein [Herbaspirillum chlorophenolicum]|uniref:WbqC family protein n=1 Tax=Herbaspirillum chlorophenolicum TaxID=211589 RepID=A0ABW8EXB0_9BURK